jgi:hypothetical protein
VTQRQKVSALFALERSSADDASASASAAHNFCLLFPFSAQVGGASASNAAKKIKKEGDDGDDDDDDDDDDDEEEDDIIMPLT